MAYFVLAIPSAFVLKKTGYKNGMSLGLLIMTIGSLVFIPAANARSFNLFLTGLFLQGSGLALLQTASNPYVSMLGPIESAAKRISIMGVCNKAAGILAPLTLSVILLSNATELENKIKSSIDPIEKNRLLDELSGRIVSPYIFIAVALFLLALFIKKSGLPEIESAEESSFARETTSQKQNVFQFRHLLLGVVCIFLYVGVEVMAGDAIGIYGKAMGMSTDETKYFTSFTLVAMLIGYMVGIATMPKLISQHNALKYSAILGILLTIAIYFSSGYTAIILIALLGLANALMWPAIFPLAITGLGRFTQIGSALLVMGIAGGAVIPLIYALLKDGSLAFSNRFSFFLCMFPAYVYILYYSIRGYKTNR